MQQTLTSTGAEFVPNKVLGVYDDNPAEKTETTCGVFRGLASLMYAQLSLQRWKAAANRQLSVCKGYGLGIMKSINDSYTALFRYIAEEKVTLKSQIDYQLLTFEKYEFSTEIYMELLAAELT